MEPSPRRLALGGKLFWSGADRLVLLGLLLEHVGVDAVVRLVIREVWPAAISELR